MTGLAVQDAPPAGHDRPLLVYSHGFGGSAIGSVYLMEYLTSRGWVVAVDHNDPISVVRISGYTDANVKKFSQSVMRLVSRGQEFDRDKYAYRPVELRAMLDQLLAESKSDKSDLAGLIDPERIGAAGHSMGGFTCLSVIGCTKKFTDKRIKAAVLQMTPTGRMRTHRAASGCSRSAGASHHV